MQSMQNDNNKHDIALSLQGGSYYQYTGAKYW